MWRRLAITAIVVLGVATATGWAAGVPQAYTTSCPATGRCWQPAEHFNWDHGVLAAGIAAIVVGLLASVLLTGRTDRR